MSIVGAFDVHRRQLTFEYLDTATGELKRGRVVLADREHLRAWLSRLAGQDEVHLALEGCTGWRYVVEELAVAGITAHLAEPADTAALRGNKRHAKTDLLTELPDVAAAQGAWLSLQPIAELSGRSGSPGRGGDSANLIAAETGHTSPDQSAVFSSLPIFGISRGGL